MLPSFLFSNIIILFFTAAAPINFPAASSVVLGTRARTRNAPKDGELYPENATYLSKGHASEFNQRHVA